MNKESNSSCFTLLTVKCSSNLNFFLALFSYLYEIQQKTCHDLSFHFMILKKSTIHKFSLKQFFSGCWKNPLLSAWFLWSVSYPSWNMATLRGQIEVKKSDAFPKLNGRTAFFFFLPLVYQFWFRQLFVPREFWAFFLILKDYFTCIFEGVFHQIWNLVLSSFPFCCHLEIW